MYGSLFREWKVAATFVGGIAIVVAVFFSEGGGHEQLQLQRKAGQSVPAAVTAPGARSPTRARPAIVGGFTPDEELEAEFAVPTPSAGAEAGDQKAAVPGPGEAAPPLAAPTALPAEPASPAEQPL